MKRTLVEELPAKVGERVRVRGWVQAVRDQKKVQFVILRDESGLVQVVLPKQEPPGELWTRTRRDFSRAQFKCRLDEVNGRFFRPRSASSWGAQPRA